MTGNIYVYCLFLIYNYNLVGYIGTGLNVFYRNIHIAFKAPWTRNEQQWDPWGPISDRVLKCWSAVVPKGWFPVVSNCWFPELLVPHRRYCWFGQQPLVALVGSVGDCW